MSKFIDLNSKTASSLQNLFAYSLVKPVFDGCFPYLKYSQKTTLGQEFLCVKNHHPKIISKFFNFSAI